MIFIVMKLVTIPCIALESVKSIATITLRDGLHVNLVDGGVLSEYESSTSDENFRMVG